MSVLQELIHLIRASGFILFNIEPELKTLQLNVWPQGVSADHSRDFKATVNILPLLYVQHIRDVSYVTVVLYISQLCLW